MDDVYALLPNIESGGEPFQPPLRTSFTNLLLLYQHASLSACKPQRKVPFGTKLYKAMTFNSSLSVSRKGGERTGEDDLHSDDPSSSPLTVASEGGC
jgi:hypothetical protein